MENENQTPARNASGIAEAGGKNALVRTFSDDMAEVISNDTGGLVKKIIHGEEIHEEEKSNLSPESKKNKIFMLVSIVLLMLAMGTLSFFFLNQPQNTAPVAPQFTPIIFNDQNTFLEVTGLKKDEIIQTVANEVNNTKVKSGGVEGIYLTLNKQIVGLRNFVTLINSNFIPNTNPALVSDNFLLGVVNSSSPGFFVLLKVRTIADVFDSMRAWEPNLLNDLHGFLRIDISADTNYLFSKNFQDGIIGNKNARILYDKDNKLVVAYIFADDNSVVITNTENAAQEIMLRLSSGQAKQ